MEMAAIIGHRGAAKIAPENTLAGILAAKACGLSWVEMDVILMGDGSLIMHHDRTLNRCTNGRGEVIKLGLNDINRFEAGDGEQIPTLQQALTLIQQLNMGINLEIKMHRHTPKALVFPVIDTLNKNPQLLEDGRVVVSSFNHPALQICRQLRPDIPLAHLFGSLPGNWLDLVQAVSAVCVNLNQRLVKKSDIVTVRDAGFEVYCYTVNKASRASKLFSWGVTGVFTDDPQPISCAIARV